jgi:tetratricopeptide (TPR) repeat protein
MDSLKFALKNARHDTTRCNVLNALIEAESDDNIWPKYNDELKTIAEKNIANNVSPKKVYLQHLADALNNIGYLANNRGNVSKALKYYHESLKITEEVGDKNGIAGTLNNIGSICYNQGNIARALEYLLKSLTIREDIGDKTGIAQSLNNIGFIYKTHGDILKALEFYHKSLKIQKAVGDKKGTATSLNNIGLIYDNQGDIPKALEYNHKSLKIREDIGDKSGIAGSLNNIGLIYDNQGDIQRALEYYHKSLKIQEEIGDKSGIAQSLNNIGLIYNGSRDIPKALECLYKSLKIREEIEDKSGTAQSLSNIGFIYDKQGDIDKALEYNNKSLKIFEEIGNKKGIAHALNNIGQLTLKKGNLKKALIYTNRSMELAKELGFPETIKNSANSLKFIFLKQKKYKEAFDMYVLEVKMRDSINNEETQKAAVKKQMQYKYEKQAAKDSVAHAKENDIKNAEIAAKKAEIKVKENTQLALYCGLALVIVFAGFLFNRFKVTQKQKHIIEIKEKETQLQKHTIEEKHKEITDSINYAERIQRSFLATTELLNENLKEHFVFFQPKDVVSGDFYWATKLGSGNFALVTADSTGHGVPGAIMSILNISCLENAVKEDNTEPSHILNHTRTNIIDRLKKDGSIEGGKDGMDASLICFDFKNKKLTYSAANNPVWIVRDNQLSELSPDKMPVGKHEKDSIPFTQHQIDLQKGDVVYALTDGMPDQFGGPKGKKFMYKQLKELIISMSSLPMSEQKETLQSALNNWKGDLEQVDDVCIIGVRV